jgi:pimeloyl-ACP methyl ester carboxylesterase
MVTLLYKPSGPGPFAVVVYSHGRSGDPAVRSHLKWPISKVQVKYWLEKNIAVVAPIRIGYGNTGGRDVESSGSVIGHDGVCHRADFTRPAGSGSAAVLATLAWVRQQPWADPHRLILEGQSVGGLATVAAAATRPEGVLGYINFGGGSGGDPDRSPGVSCEPQRLGELYREFGKTTTMPNLWVYAQNDQYWGPDQPVAWHTGFAAGGSPSQFVHAPPVADGDGHGLSRHERALWAPYVDTFLQGLGL